jgi:predicted peptidase
MKTNGSFALCVGLAAALLVSGCKHSAVSSKETGRQVAARFEQKLTRPVAYDYLISLPPTYGEDKHEKWPLLLFLHGMGERGTNVWKVAVHGPPKLIQQERQLPFITVSPQCPSGQFWDPHAVVALVDEISRKYAVDPSRIYITGLSMGGYGTWDVITLYPEKFAAAVPICGGGNLVAVAAQEGQKSAAYKQLPVWVFHGAKDRVVPLSESEQMVDMLKRRNGNVKLTVYPEAEHDSWTQTYNNPDLYDWLLKQQRR